MLKSAFPAGGLFKFLKIKFDELPRVIQIIVYLVLLVVFVYMLLFPRVISGRIYFKDSDGGHHPYRSAIIILHQSGREYKFLTNENGFWTIPLFSFLPGKVRLMVIRSGTEVQIPVEIDFSSLIKNGIFKSDLEMEMDPIKAEIRIVSTFNDGGRFFRAGSRFVELISPTFQTLSAQELQLTEPMNSYNFDSELRSMGDINSRVLQIISESLSVYNQDLSRDFELTFKNNIDVFERIIIVENVEKEFNLEIPDEHWNNLTTVNQIADYIYNRDILLEYVREKGYEENESYRMMIQSLPEDERPIFSTH